MRAPGSSRTRRPARCSPRHDARDQTPIASITKLMTVLVALQHLKLSRRRRRRPARRRGRPGVDLPRAGQQITVARSREGGADPVGERRRRRARARDRSELRRVRGADERARRRQLGLTDSHFVRPDGLDAPGELLERARRHPARARRDEAIPVVRDAVATSTATIAGGRDAPHVERPARRRPGRLRRQDRTYRRRRLERRSRPCAGDGDDDLRDDPRQPVARAAQRRPRRRCSPTGSPSTGRSTRSRAGRAYAQRRAPLRPRAARARRRGAAPSRRARRACR